MTKRYYTMPHHHQDPSQPHLLLNGELHPADLQPPGATEKYKTYTKHVLQ
eukprot:CAMPEP_0202956964 /NCGR_PEP_ID=MMETSP1396-20130829/1413_1 /ASSEMBLY_ACC=CAM_ASM_000872 /TAXON_ID= /ORGANISM="Pseudokeronopsis sp., Strain Brazil" /LENGTH=49 /DNA_ID=CAMNT_0049674207 /DNA_START=149 /DNA_END=298 /DNA_ORIENTATION=+